MTACRAWLSSTMSVAAGERSARSGGFEDRSDQGGRLPQSCPRSAASMRCENPRAALSRVTWGSRMERYFLAYD